MGSRTPQPDRVEDGLFKVTWLTSRSKEPKVRYFLEGEFDLALLFYLSRLAETEVERADISADKTGQHHKTFGQLIRFLHLDKDSDG